MLVLSRKLGQSILFPALGIEVRLCQTAKRGATLGVNAPRSLRIVRSELAGPRNATDNQPRAARSEHQVRNTLNTVGLTVDALRRQLDRGVALDSTLLARATADLRMLEWDSAGLDPPPGTLTDLEPVGGQPSGDGASPAVRGGACRTFGGTPPPNIAGRRQLAMIVEDNENESSLMAGLLQNEGYEVVTAIDGLAAITYLTSEQPTPDLVLMDMAMPRLDGAETIRRIRRDHRLRPIPIYGVSGSRPEENDIVIGEDGVNCWFQKPVRPDEFITALRQFATPEGKPV